MDRVMKLEVAGYQIRRGGEMLGAVGTGNTVLLQLSFDAAWDGMSKTAKFTDARGDGGVTTEIELLTQNPDGSFTVPVPREAMAYEGTAELTLIGEITEETTVVKRLTTKPLPLRVCASGADREAQNTQPITATDKQQILAKINVAEAYAKGTVDGSAVDEGETGWHDNAAYYRDLAASAAIAAETAQGKAEDAQEAAENAQSAAETAQGKAENAQTAAEAAQDAADDAQEAAETAQGKAENAQEAAESAQSAAESARDAILAAQTQLDSLVAHRYDAFASETQNGRRLLHTDLGADGLPLLKMRLDFMADAEGTAGLFSGFTLRHCGKNLLDCSAAKANPDNGTTTYRGLTFSQTEGGFSITGTVENDSVFRRSSLIGLAAYPIGIPVFPDVTYAFSCGVTQTDGDIPNTLLSAERLSLRVRFADGTFQDFAQGSSFTPAQSGYAELIKSEEALTFRSQHHYELHFTPQLEIGAAVSDFAAYSGTDHTITLSGFGAPATAGWIDLLSGTGVDDDGGDGAAIACTPLALCSAKGANCFYTLPRSGSPGDVMLLSCSYRVDPTLAFEKLKTAISAAATQ